MGTEDSERRAFRRAWQWATFVAIPGIGLLIDPFYHNGKKRRRHRLLKLSDLEIGIPRKLMIVERRIDAWTYYPEGPIGAVWLNRHEDGSVDAFSATCPHLGCQIKYTNMDEQFVCPCHKARFSTDGSLADGPTQRGLDRLNVKIDTVRGEEWVSVLFERYELGTKEKTAVG